MTCGNCDGAGSIAAQPEQDDPYGSWQDARGDWRHDCQDCAGAGVLKCIALTNDRLAAKK